MKRLITCVLLSAGLLAASSVIAAETRYVVADEIPTPLEVARALAGADFQPTMRRRGISMDQRNAPEPRDMSGNALATAGTPGAAAVVAAEPQRSSPSPRAAGGTLAVAIAFEFNSASLQPKALAQLDSIAEGLKLLDKAHIQIEGHTDSVGAAAYNLSLSERRASAVKAYLVEQHDLLTSSLQVEGLGMTQPIAGLAPDAAANRRVAFRLN